MTKSASSKPKAQKDERNTGSSANNLKFDAFETRHIYDAMWNNAARAPMFCRTKKVADREGKMKTVRRTTRLISSAAFKIAASGAALNAKATLGKECSEVRVKPRSELAKNPWLPSVSPGACMMLEQFLAAVAQEAAYKAHVYREGCGGAMRVNKAYIKMGWNATMDSVFSSTLPLPRVVFVVPEEKKTAKKEGKDKEGDEYTPPDEDEQNPAPEGSAEDIAGGD